MVKKGCDQSGLCTLKLHLQNEQMELTDSLHADTNSHKLKGDWKFWGELGCDQSGDGTQKLTVSKEWTDGINWFFTCSYRFTKIKSWSEMFCVVMVKNGCYQPGHRTLKLTVSQKWAGGINWFFAYWYKFRKAKSWFNIFGCAWSKMAIAF